MPPINGDAGDNVLFGTFGDDEINGLGGNDSLNGDFGNDSLNGGVGADTLIGSAGIDTLVYTGSNGGVTVTLNRNNVTTGQRNDAQGDQISGFENIIGSSFDDSLTGDSAANRLDGREGNDTLVGGLNDTLLGGLGDDTYVLDNQPFTITELAGEGTDLVLTSGFAISIAGFANVENLTYTANEGVAFFATGNDGANTITAGLASGSVLNGGLGNDTLIGSAFDDSLSGGDDADLLVGNAGVDQLSGGNGDDTLIGGIGDDILNGGIGTDTINLSGLQSAYSFSRNATQIFVTHNTPNSDGADTLIDVERISFAGQNSVALSTFIGTIIGNGITGTAAGEALSGTALADFIDGGGGNDTITGFAGADVLIGGADNDTLVYTGSNGGVTVTLNGNNVTIGQRNDAQGDQISGFENIIGSEFNDSLTGDSAANRLDARAGTDTLVGGFNDTLLGGIGDDTYVVDDQSVTITELAGEGIDLVQTNLETFSLAGYANVENLTYTGVALFTGTGNSGANVITSLTSTNSFLFGGLGNDTLIGSGSSDRLTGGDDADRLIGNAGNDSLFGENGDDTLVGGIGNDGLFGGAGVDVAIFSQAQANYTFTLTATGIRVANAVDGTDTLVDIERVGFGGLDSVALSTIIGNLTIGTAAGETFAGTALADFIDGAGGNDTITGFAGADVLIGGTEIDTLVYTGSNGGVTVTLNGNSVTTGLRNDAQGDQISGFENIIGSEFNDSLTGDGGANRLDARAGTDTLVGSFGDTLLGGLGDDTYVVDDRNVTVTELAGEGTDVVQTSNFLFSIASYANVENLTYTGNGVFNGTGNAGANIISAGSAGGSLVLSGGLGNDTLVGGVFGDQLFGDDNADRLLGNAGADELFGGNGDDILGGGAGDDTLNGGTGIDVAIFSQAQANYTFTLTANGIRVANAVDGTDLLVDVERVGFAGLDSVALNTIIGNGITGTGASETFSGTVLADFIDGGGGNDTITGFAGADVLIGGADNDTLVYTGSNGGVTVTLNGNTVTNGLRNDAQGDQISGFENIIGSDFNDSLTGDSASNRLDARAGTDTLVGGFGDTLLGGIGDDTYVVDDQGVILRELAGEGLDGVLIGLGVFSLANFANVENLTYTGNAGFNGIGNDGANTISAVGAGGTSLLFGGLGNDTLIGGAFSDQLFGDDNSDRLVGNAGADELMGGSGDDTLIGGTGDDILNGGIGTDTINLIGLQSAYSFSRNATQIFVTHNTPNSDGSDTLFDVERISFAGENSVALSSIFGALTINAAGLSSSLTGTSLIDYIDGGDGADTITGLAGADVLIGGTGIDTLVYTGSEGGVTVTLNGNTATTGLRNDAQGDQISGFENIIGSGFNDSLTGDSEANRLDARAGTDTLVGGLGDTLIGGIGDDTYVVNDQSVTITELAGEGLDGVLTNLEFLSIAGYANIENLTYTGTIGFTGTGNGGANTISLVNAGVRGNLSGGLGNDTLIGGAFGDLLIGGDDADRLVGNGGVDELNGENGDDTLIGGTGNDRIDGGAGTDTVNFSGLQSAYTFSTNGAVFFVTHNTPNADGMDTLSNVERVSFAGQNSVALNTIFGITIIDAPGLLSNLTGTSLIDFLDGGDDGDTIAGLAGADVLLGRAGNDTLNYAASNGGVTITLDGSNFTTGQRNDAQGDQISGFENIIGSGFNDSLTGDSENNRLEGRAGLDTLAGGLGDNLIGGIGDDTYVVDNQSVTITELAGEGNDVVQTNSNGFSIAGYANVENLTYTGVDSFNGTGNDGANIISGGTSNFANLFGGFGNDTLIGGAFSDSLNGDDNSDRLLGNAGADELFGGNGDDTLGGGAGDDTLNGGTGSDAAIFSQAQANYTFTATSTGIRVVNAVDGTDLLVDIERAGFAGLDAVLLSSIAGSSTTGTVAAEAFSGTAFGDYIDGFDGDDTITGLAGADELIGGFGIDTLVYTGSNGGVTVTLDGNNVTIGQRNDAQGDRISSFENIIGSGFNDSLTGDSINNRLEGRAGTDTLVGGLNDTLLGGLGDDTYVVDDQSVTITELAAEGLDGVLTNLSAFSIASFANVENLTYTGNFGFEGTGNSGANVLSAVTSNFATLSGGFGNDTLIGGGFRDLLFGEDGADRILGNAGSDDLFGGIGDDTLGGGAGDDRLFGGAGIDVAIFSQAQANYTFTLTVNGIRVVNAVDGTDTLVDIERVGFAGLDSVALSTIIGSSTTGTAAAEAFSGTALADYIDGGEGDDTITGFAGADELIGGNGIDTLVYTGSAGGVTVTLDGNNVTTGLRNDAQGDQISGLENIIGSGFNDSLTGDSAANRLDARAGTDTLVGGFNDTLIGGLGDDTYVVDTDNLTITELAAEGRDGVLTSNFVFSIASFANVENLTFTGIGAFNGTGNAGANTITAGASNNSNLSGGLGNDTLLGGALGDQLFGQDDADSLIGNAGDDQLFGGNGNDTLVGGAGDDFLDGGLGTDRAILSQTSNFYTFTVQSVGFSVSSVLEGTDTYVNVEQVNFGGEGAIVISSFLGSSISGTGIDEALSGTGFADYISGFGGNDTLAGLVGADTLDGGTGTDTLNYSASNAAVTVVLDSERFSVGAGGHAQGDLVFGFENIIGSGFNDSLIGDFSANQLEGGFGNDTLSGGFNDTLIGGDGNDIYLVNGNSGYTITETLTGGIDTIILNDISVGSFSLGNYLNVENFQFAASPRRIFPISVTGNESNNAIIGVSSNPALGFADVLSGLGGNDSLTALGGDDVLDGGEGNDTLIGGTGSDLLTGGTGNDRFVFDSNPGVTGQFDVITDFVSGSDRLDISRNAFAGFGTATTLTAAQFNNGAAVGTGAQFFSVGFGGSGSANVFYDADGTGATAAIKIIEIEGLNNVQRTLLFSDFSLI